MPARIASCTVRSVDLLAVEEQRPAVPAAVRAAEDAAGQLGAAGAHQPGDADDLAAPHVEVGVVGSRPAVVVLRMHAPSSPRPRRAPRRSRARGRGTGARGRGRPCPRMIRSSSTSPTLTSRVSMVRPSRRIVIASATRAISFSLWLIMIEVMPLPCRPLSRSSRWVGVVVVERGGRLVEDQQLDLLAERLGDLDQLLLADAEVLDRGERVLPQADPGQQLDGPVVGLVPVDDAAAWPSRCRGRCSRRSRARGSAPAPGG